MRESGPGFSQRGVLLVLRAAAVLVIATGINDVIAGAVRSYEPLYGYLVAVALVVWLDGVLIGLICALPATAAYALLFMARPAAMSVRVLAPLSATVGVAIVAGVLRAVLRRRRPEPVTYVPVVATPLLAAPVQDMTEVLDAIEDLREELRSAVTRDDGDELERVRARERTLARECADAEARAMRAAREIESMHADVLDRTARVRELETHLETERAGARGTAARVGELQTERQELRRALETARTNASVLAARAERLEREAELRRQDGSAHADLRHELDRARLEVTAQSARLMQAEARGKVFEGEGAELRRERDGARAEAERAVAHAAALEEQSAEAKRRVAAAEIAAGAAAARVREVEARAVEAESAAGAAAERAAASEEQIVAAKEQIATAEARAVQAAGAAKAAAERAAASEEQIVSAKEQIVTAEARAAEAEGAAKTANERAADVEARGAATTVLIAGLETRAIEAEARAVEAEGVARAAVARVAHAEARVLAMTARIADSETRAMQASALVAGSDEQIAAAAEQIATIEARASEAEAAARAATERAGELQAQALEASAREAQAITRQHEAEARAREAATLTFAAEARAAEAEERVTTGSTAFDERLQTIVNHLAVDHETDLGKALEEREAARAETRSLTTRLAAMQHGVEDLRAAAQKEIDRLRRRVADLERGAAPAARRPRVLIAYPDPDMRAAARASLERAGYEILSAADGLEALRTAMASKPDVVIADISMPKMDGRELCQMLKSQEKTAAIRVVLLTREGDTMPRGDHAADAILHKPVPLEALKTALAQLVPGTRP